MTKDSIEKAKVIKEEEEKKEKIIREDLI